MKTVLRTILQTVTLVGCLLSCIEAANADRKAFLIGISDYESLPQLKNPSWDIAAIRQKLESVGFKTTAVTSKAQTAQKQLLSSWGVFLKTLNKGDEVVVYYSGHGVDIRGENLLVPSDSPKADDIIGESLLRSSLISLRALVTDLEDRQLMIQVWIVDACRENPFINAGKAIGAKGGLHKIEPEIGSFIFLSAGYNQIAKDRLPEDSR